MTEPGHYMPRYRTVEAYMDAEAGLPDVQEVELTQEESDWVLITEACAWCPEHHSKECSPLRNGCGKIDAQRQALKRRHEAADALS